jgi:multidrug efflux pump
LVSGAGAAARNSIGLVVVSGMALGTLFTLFVLPAIYVLLAKDHHTEAAKHAASAEPQLALAGE